MAFGVFAPALFWLAPFAAAQSQSAPISSPVSEAQLESRIDPLPPEAVFAFSAESGGQEARAVFTMPEGFYLYREQFRLAVSTPGFAVEEASFSPAENYDDPFFGITDIYNNSATLSAKIRGEGRYELRVISQGCDKVLSICYPPQTHVAMLETGGAPLAPIAGLSAAPNAAYKTAESESETKSKSESKTKSATESKTAPASADEAADAAAVLAENNIWQIIALFFGFGVLLSFTPCVLPMLPILLGVISGGGGRRRTGALTAAYIGGVAAAYTMLGIAAGLSGQLLAPFLQRPPVLIASSVLLAGLALSMFGLYDIRPPAFMRRAGMGGGGGRLGGAFAMGALSAAVASPCVAAPLIGALVYIGGTGDAVTGGLALLSLSLGMSVLLAAAGIGGGEILPRAGAWTNDIKQLSGALLLGAAVWVSSSLLPAAAALLLYGGLLAYCGVLLWGEGGGGNMRRFARGLGIVALLWGGAMILGAAGGGRDPLAPLANFGGGKSAEAAQFAPVHSLPELQRELSAANRPAMLEFYADWCVSCKEMEKFTFADARVLRRLQPMLLLRADVTENNEAHQALLAEFGLYGPPAILFFGADGEIIPGVRVNGYQSADKFLQTLNAAGG